MEKGERPRARIDDTATLHYGSRHCVMNEGRVTLASQSQRCFDLGWFGAGDRGPEPPLVVVASGRPFLV